MLTRHPNLPAGARRLHDGPVAGGCFWALAKANDLPHGPRAHADPAAMLKHGRLWWQDARKPGTWRPVASPAQIADLQRRAVASFGDDYEACTSGFGFVPEFYFVPRNWRGRRLVARAANRAFDRF